MGIWKRILGWHIGDFVKFSSGKITEYGIIIDFHSPDTCVILVLRNNGFLVRPPTKTLRKEADLEEWKPRKPEKEKTRLEKYVGKSLG